MEAKCLLVLLARDRMRSYALRITRRYRGLIERDEILSAVDLALLKAANRYQHTRGAFVPYACIWVRCEVFKLVRSELGWLGRRVDAVELEEREGDAASYDEVERMEITELLKRGMHELWSAHVAEGRTLRELAAAHKMSLRQVQQRISRSQRRLRQHAGVRLGASRRARCH